MRDRAIIQLTEKMRVIIQWPRGSSLPVRISPNATIEDLAHLLKFALRPFEEMVLLHHNIILHPYATLESQGITEDEKIAVVIQARSYLSKDDYEDDITSKMRLQIMIQDVFQEFLRLNDLRVNAVDTYLIQQGAAALLDYDDESDDSDIEPTNLEPTPSKISDDPLPKFWVSDLSTDIEDPAPVSILSRFHSIEEAGAFFSKGKWSEWMW